MYNDHNITTIATIPAVEPKDWILHLIPPPLYPNDEAKARSFERNTSKPILNHKLALPPVFCTRVSDGSGDSGSEESASEGENDDDVDKEEDDEEDDEDDEDGDNGCSSRS